MRGRCRDIPFHGSWRVCLRQTSQYLKGMETTDEVIAETNGFAQTNDLCKPRHLASNIYHLASKRHRPLRKGLRRSLISSIHQFSAMTSSTASGPPSPIRGRLDGVCTKPFRRGEHRSPAEFVRTSAAAASGRPTAHRGFVRNLLWYRRGGACPSRRNPYKPHGRGKPLPYGTPEVGASKKAVANATAFYHFLSALILNRFPHGNCSI